MCLKYRGADKSLARPGMKQARKHVRDERDFNNIETRDVMKHFFSLQGKAPKEIHAILTETLACFLPDRAKDLSGPYEINIRMIRRTVLTLKRLLKRFYTGFLKDYLKRGNELEFSGM